MDELIDELLHNERCCDIILPRIQKRHILEQNEQLEPRVSILDDDLSDVDSEEEEEEPEKSPSRRRSSSPSHHDHDHRRKDEDKRKDKDRRDNRRCHYSRGQCVTSYFMIPQVGYLYANFYSESSCRYIIFLRETSHFTKISQRFLYIYRFYS